MSSNLNLFEFPPEDNFKAPPPEEIINLIGRGAMFMVNHSAGKDISTTTTM